MTKSIVEIDVRKFLLIGIASIVFLGFGFSDAFAGGGVALNEFVASDPDNADTMYSAGDTFNLGFSIPTNQSGVATQANILGNFTFDVNPGSTFSGVWTNNQNLLITVITVGPSPIIGVHRVEMLGTNTIGDFNPHPDFENAQGSAFLSGNYGDYVGTMQKGGFQPPIMGVTPHGRNLVEDGFSYNDNAVDVGSMKTPFPLVTTQVGDENVVKLKIYSPRGNDRFQHAAVAFGLDQHEIFGDSKVVIEWDRPLNGEENLTVIDPENYLADVRVETSAGECRTDSNDQCIIIEFYHTFRKPLDHNKIGTYIWDNARYGWNNYFNDGLEIVGDSLDPPAKHQVIDKGKIIEIMEVGKNIALDQEGRVWTFDKFWEMEYKPAGKIDDGISSHGIDRDNVRFQIYREGQILLAEYLLENTVDGSMIQSKILEESKTYDHDYVSRSEDIELQNRITYEIKRSNELSSDRFVVNDDDKFQKYWEIYSQFLEKNS